MNLIILNIGLIFVALGTTTAQTAKEIKDQINVIRSNAELILRKARSIRDTDLLKFPQQILEITESNKLIIQTKSQLKKYEGKSEAAKDCRLLFNANYFSIIDQLYVQANDLITIYLSVSVDGLLKTVNAKLNELTKQVDNWDKTSLKDKDQIIKEINQISMTLDGSKKSVSILVQYTLRNIEINVFPSVAQQNISKPITGCLKKIKSLPDRN